MKEQYLKPQMEAIEITCELSMLNGSNTFTPFLCDEELGDEDDFD